MQKISCFRHQSAAHRLPIKDCGWKSITAYGICASIKPRAADEDTVIKQMLMRSLTTPKCIDCSYLTPILSDKHVCENVLIKTLGLDDNALLLVSECVPVNSFFDVFTEMVQLPLTHWQIILTHLSETNLKFSHSLMSTLDWVSLCTVQSPVLSQAFKALD